MFPLRGESVQMNENISQTELLLDPGTAIAIQVYILYHVRKLISTCI